MLIQLLLDVCSCTYCTSQIQQTQSPCNHVPSHASAAQTRLLVAAVIYGLALLAFTVLCCAGLSVPDYGPWCTPGYLPRPADPIQQSTVPNLPAKSGTGTMLAPARLMPGSCCPSPFSEPLVAMDSEAKGIIAGVTVHKSL